MSREIYTYTTLKDLTTDETLKGLLKYPQVAVSADLKKTLKENKNYDKIEGWFTNDESFQVVDFHSLACEIDDNFDSDKNKFDLMVNLSSYIRNLRDKYKGDDKKLRWLTGCSRNLGCVSAAIYLLEKANVRPEDLQVKGDKNLEFFVDIWKEVENNSLIAEFRKKMSFFESKDVSKEAIKKELKPSLNKFFKGREEENTIVFHDFYYITPYQERMMAILENAGYKLIMLFPYNKEHSFVYEIWDKTYANNSKYDSKDKWHIKENKEEDRVAEVFEGKKTTLTNVSIKEYASEIEYVNDMRKIKNNGFMIYSTNHKKANDILQKFYPEEYSDRKILSYPIGQFITLLNQMWDDEMGTISLDEEKLIDCFSSGWLSVDGISGKQYMKDLYHILPFFSGCKTIDQWEQRIELLKTIKQDVIDPFRHEKSVDESITRWQDTLENPLSYFSMFTVEDSHLDCILKLIEQLLLMAKDLFMDNSMISIVDHLKKLENILNRVERSDELYDEEKKIVEDLFKKLNEPGKYSGKCLPSDISVALNLYLYGRMDESEFESYNKIDMVSPMYFIDVCEVKNDGKAHICFCDVDNMPGKDKNYVWPLTRKTILACLEKTNNYLIEYMENILSSTVYCNRYFMYCALKCSEVQLSWVSQFEEKKMSPSLYIKMLKHNANIDIKPPYKKWISMESIKEADININKIKAYDNDRMPLNIPKEAQWDYAACPMRYLLGYVVEKHPTYQSGFQQTFALSSLVISIYELLKDDGVSLQDVYENVMSLFPNLRKIEKRQAYDYILGMEANNNEEFDYKRRTQYGQYYYTDERLRLQYPRSEAREAVIAAFSKLYTPDGRRGLNLEEGPIGKVSCDMCPHISYCRIATYALDKEDLYD